MKIAPVIIALDMQDINKVKSFVDKFDQPTWFKVGMELTYSQGFEIIKYLKDKNHKVFLDLKLFDIPNTVQKSLKSISKYNVDITTIHALGGLEMMKAAKDASSNLKILGVTILTSINQKTLTKEIKIKQSIEHLVVHLATLVKKAKLFGVVCSAQEATLIKNLGLTIVTPGIRRKNNTSDDQKRITTPAQAKANGADYIVVGRPITQSDNPLQTYKEFVKEFK